MFEILRYQDREEWKQILASIGANDPFSDPDYLKINEIIIPGELECFVYRDRRSLVAYPYIKRRIGNTDWFDVTSAYGYGGFIGFPSGASTSEFHRAFCGYCRDNGIVSEFIRFHPMVHDPEQMNGGNLKVVYHQPVVWVDYGEQDFIAKGCVNKEVRKKLAKAERNGVAIIEDRERIYWNQFCNLYNQTMDAKRASAFYHFDGRFFRALEELLGPQCSLLVALHEGRVIGGLLMLFSERFGYNFLSGSDYACNSFGTNEALQCKALEAGQRRGLRGYLLGGGRGGEDSLFQFKAKFSTQRKGFFIGSRIHLPETYELICGTRGVAESTESNYFPLYRCAAAERGSDDSRLRPAAMQCVFFPLLQATEEAMFAIRDVMSGWVY